MRTVAIIQARMGSTRLPGKVLAEVCEKPLLQHMIERLSGCETLDQVAVAVPWNISSLPIKAAVANLEATCVKGGGSEEDVLGRVLDVAHSTRADLIVELTADCPLIDPEIVDEAVKRFLGSQSLHPPLALVSTSRPSFHPRNRRYAYPPGMDVRVFTTKTLEEVDRLTQDPVDREHVSLYIWEHQRQFWCHDFLAPPELQDDVRLTVDTPEDLELVKTIFEEFLPHYPEFGLRDILELLEYRPELREINRHVQQKVAR